MNLDICRKCEEKYCWIYFNTVEYTVEISKVICKDSSNRYVVMRMDDRHIFESATEAIIKEDNNFYLYKETATHSDVTEEVHDNLRTVVAWPFDKYAPNSDGSRKSCRYYTEHVLDALSRRNDES